MLPDVIRSEIMRAIHTIEAQSIQSQPALVTAAKSALTAGSVPSHDRARYDMTFRQYDQGSGFIYGMPSSTFKVFT
jgi:hypothetical protein